MLTPIGKKIVNKYTNIYHLIQLHTDLNTNDINLRVNTENQS